MFAPPICGRRWWNSAFPFRQLRRRRRQPANIAGSGASNQISDVRAADLQEEMVEQRFSVPSAPTKTAATSEHRRERSEQSNKARDARAAPKKSNRIDAYLVCGRKSVFYASCERRHT
jgi:hypothetical protein